MCIEAVEDSLLLQIDHHDFHALLGQFPKLERNFRVIIENKYIKLEERVIQSLSLTTEEKYLNFVSQNPDLNNRLPNVQIASYLGITPEFLSKIRGGIAKK
jgi:CRP/FNR family transcriptional regulator, anaerobic regulatory protein